MRIATLKSAFVFLALIAAITRPSFAETTECDDIFGYLKAHLENAYGKEYKVKLIEHRGVRLGEDESHPGVFLGFNEYGHSYLSVNGLRLDGKIFGLEEVRKRSVLDPGIIFRFHVTPEQAEKLQKVVARHNHHISVTCIRSACKTLNQGGVKLPTSITESFFLAPTFKRLLEEGATDAKTGEPIQLEIYALRDSHIQEMHETLQFRDKNLTQPYIIRAKRAAIGAAVIAGGVAAASTTDIDDEFWVYLRNHSPFTE